MTVTVNFSGLEPITEAINNLARSIGASGVVTTINGETVMPSHSPASPAQEVPAAVAPSIPVTPTPQLVPVVATPQPAAPVPAAPLQQPVTPIPVAPAQQPVTPIPTVPSRQENAAVPTSTPSYTADDLAKAAISLMDAGRQNDLIALLQQFGVTSVPNLQPAQYGAFATAIRGMGAQI